MLIFCKILTDAKVSVCLRLIHCFLEGNIVSIINLKSKIFYSHRNLKDKLFMTQIVFNFEPNLEQYFHFNFIF